MKEGYDIHGKLWNDDIKDANVQSCTSNEMMTSKSITKAQEKAASNKKDTTAAQM